MRHRERREERGIDRERETRAHREQATRGGLISQQNGQESGPRNGSLGCLLLYPPQSVIVPYLLLPPPSSSIFVSIPSASHPVIPIHSPPYSSTTPPPHTNLFFFFPFFSHLSLPLLLHTLTLAGLIITTRWLSLSPSDSLSSLLPPSSQERFPPSLTTHSHC